jgi:pyrroloquinoline-quinone synthase
MGRGAVYSYFTLEITFARKSTMTTAAATLETTVFWKQIDQRIGKYDLLCHPFYKAWSAGELTREDLREYAADYYHHVAAFPTYLSALHSRLPDGELRRAVLRNLSDEEIEGAAHSDLWLNFASGMGGEAAELRNSAPVKEVAELIAAFKDVAANGSTAAALAAVYAYESQVPQVAKAKASGLKELYGADAKTCGYFTLHQTADVRHAQVWREQLDVELVRNPETTADALNAAEHAAAALWKALDGIERKRQARRAN